MAAQPRGSRGNPSPAVKFHALPLALALVKYFSAPPSSWSWTSSFSLASAVAVKEARVADAVALAVIERALDRGDMHEPRL